MKHFAVALTLCLTLILSTSAFADKAGLQRSQAQKHAHDQAAAAQRVAAEKKAKEEAAKKKKKAQEEGQASDAPTAPGGE